MEDLIYEEKLKNMRKYVPFLEKMVEKIKSGSDRQPEASRESQLRKFKTLQDLLLNTEKKMKMESLIKCENVLKKLHATFEKSISTNGIAVSQGAQRFEDLSGPASPPPQSVEEIQPVEIPTERRCSPLQFNDNKDSYRKTINKPLNASSKALNSYKDNCKYFHDPKNKHQTDNFMRANDSYQKASFNTRTRLKIEDCKRPALTIPPFLDVLQSPPLTSTDISNLLRESKCESPSNTYISDIGTRRSYNNESTETELDVVRKKLAMITKKSSQINSSKSIDLMSNSTNYVPQQDIPTERIALKYNPHPRVQKNSDMNNSFNNEKIGNGSYRKKPPNVNLLPSVNPSDPRLRRGNIPSLLSLPLIPPANVGQNNVHERTNSREKDRNLVQPKYNSFVNADNSTICRQSHNANKFSWSNEMKHNKLHSHETSSKSLPNFRYGNNSKPNKFKYVKPDRDARDITSRISNCSKGAYHNSHENYSSKQQSTPFVDSKKKIPDVSNPKKETGNDGNINKNPRANLNCGDSNKKSSAVTVINERKSQELDKVDHLIHKQNTTGTLFEKTGSQNSSGVQSNLDKLYRCSSFSGCDFPKTKTNFKIPKKQSQQKDGSSDKNLDNKNKDIITTTSVKMVQPKENIIKGIIPNNINQKINPNKESTSKEKLSCIGSVKSNVIKECATKEKLLDVPNPKTNLKQESVSKDKSLNVEDQKFIFNKEKLYSTTLHQNTGLSKEDTTKETYSNIAEKNSNLKEVTVVNEKCNLKPVNKNKSSDMSEGNTNKDLSNIVVRGKCTENVGLIDGPTLQPRRIIKRRCTMMTFGSAPEVDKDKVHLSKSIMLEDLDTRKQNARRNKLLAEIHQKTDDNCTVSTQNIITGKRRTRATINFNEIQQTRAIFGIKPAQESRKVCSPKIVNPKKGTETIINKKRDITSVLPTKSSPNLTSKTKITRSSNSFKDRNLKEFDEKSNVKKCETKIRNKDTFKNVNTHSLDDSFTTIESNISVSNKIPIKVKNATSSRCRSRTPQVDQTDTSLEEDKQDLLENFVQDMLKPNADIKYIFGLLEQILTEDKLKLVKNIIESATAENLSTNSEYKNEDIQMSESKNFDPNKKSENILETVEKKQKCSNKHDSQEPILKRGKRRNELDRLNDDIRDMFISEGVVTATGRRMCTLVAKTQMQTKSKTLPEDEANERKEDLSADHSKIIEVPNTITPEPTKNILKTSPVRLRKLNVVLSPIDTRLLRRSTRIKLDKADIQDDSSSQSKVDESKLDEVEDGESQIEDQSSKSSNQSNDGSVDISRTEKKLEEDSDDEINLASLVKRTKYSNNDESNTEEVTYSENDLKIVKNTDINWHSQSKYAKWCVICDEHIPHAAIHYKMYHQEHYASRLKPSILQKLKEGKLSKPIFGIEKKSHINWFYCCPFCLQYNRTTVKFWQEHFIIHTGEYIFECSKCHKPGQRSSIEKHILTCKGAKLIRNHYIQAQNIIKAHICHLCNFLQMSRENLNKHYVSHHDCNIENVKGFGYSIDLMNVDNVQIVDEKKAIMLENVTKKTSKSESFIILDEDSLKINANEVEHQISECKDNENNTNIEMNNEVMHEKSVSFTDRLCQRLKDFNEKRIVPSTPPTLIDTDIGLKISMEEESIDLTRENDDNHSDHKDDNISKQDLHVDDPSVTFLCDDKVEEDDDEENWEDIEIIDTCNKESKLKKVDIFPKFQKLCGGLMSHKSVFKSKRNFNTKKKKQNSTDSYTSSQVGKNKGLLSNPEISFPSIGNLSDFLPDSPSNDPIDLIPELTRNQPLQDLNDLSSLLETNFDSPDMENLEQAMENSISGICFSNDIAQTSIEEALDLIHNDLNNIPVTSNIESDTNSTNKSSTQAGLNHIQNIGYSETLEGSYKFYCLLNDCTFLYSSNIVGLEYHYMSEHPQIKWNGYCMTCKNQIRFKNGEENIFPISEETKHIKENHTATVAKFQTNTGNKIGQSEKPLLKIRRLSGDCLSGSLPKEDSSNSSIINQSTDLLSLLIAKPKPPTIPMPPMGTVESELSLKERNISKKSISNSTLQTEIPKILDVCSLNDNAMEAMWPEYSHKNLKGNSMKNGNESPEPIIVSETVPAGQATSGDFLLTQSVSAQYDSNNSGTNDAKVGFNISISNTIIQNNSIVASSTKESSTNKNTIRTLYKCMANGCKFQTRVPVAMADHLNFHETRNSSLHKDYLQCPHCNNISENISNYMKHIEETHKICGYQVETIKQTPCDVDVVKNTNNSSTYKEQLEQTIKEIVSYTGVSDETLYRCVLNGCQATLSPATFQSHINQHLFESNLNGGNVIFKCPHCSATYQRLAGIKAHIKCHIRHNYFCYICTITAANPGQIMKHFADKHWQTLNLHTSVLLNLPSNIYRDEVIYYVAHSEKLNEKELQQFGEKLIGDWQRKKASSKTHFHPSETALLPIQPIFQDEKYCAECMYKTKVRTNLLRHLQMHNNEIKSIDQRPQVAIVDPVNPMPCLNAKERHFDKMTNLASSSLNPNSSAVSSTTSKDVNYKIAYSYIPDNKLFTCGVKECKYLTISDDIFRSHLNALHGNILSYNCPFCNEEICKRILSVERILQHLRYHGHKLFQCEECNYLHYMKSVVARHIKESHLYLQVNLLTHSRATEGSTNGVTVKKLMNGKKYKENPSSPEMTLKEPMVDNSTSKINYKWNCNFCDYEANSQPQIMSHCAMHANNAPGQNIFDLYHKVPNNSPIDTRPLWLRDDPKRIRHIRGILMENEEESEQHRKSISDIHEDEEDISNNVSSGKMSNVSNDIIESTNSNQSANLYLNLFELGCFHCDYRSNYGNLRKLHWSYVHNNSDYWKRPFLFHLFMYLKCPECLLFTGNYKHLQQHLKVVHKKTAFYAADPNDSGIVCGYCNFTCVNPSQLQKHHSCAKHEENDCKNFDMQKLSTLLKLGTNETYYRCGVCGKLNASASSASHHGRKHNKSNDFSFKELKNVIIYKCNSCHFTSESKMETLRHMIDHYGEFKICRFCKQIQTSFSAYMQHCDTNHRKEIQNFNQLYTFTEIKRYLLGILYIFPNGLVLNMKNLQFTEYANDGHLKEVYDEICQTAKQPPIPRLSIAQLVARKINEGAKFDINDQFKMAGFNLPQKISNRRNTVAFEHRKRKFPIDSFLDGDKKEKYLKISSNQKNIDSISDPIKPFPDEILNPQIIKNLNRRMSTVVYNPIYTIDDNSSAEEINSNAKQLVSPSKSQSKPQVIFLQPENKKLQNTIKKISERRRTIAGDKNNSDLDVTKGN